MEKFFHYYHPAEVSQSKGMYNFTPRSPLLRLICENPDSNRDWKSCYFFLEGDEWMCHPGDNEFMPIDKTLGIMPPSGMRLSTEIYFCFNFSLTSNCLSPCAARDHPPVSLEQFSFLKKIFNKTSLKKGHGLNWSIWIPCTGIVMDQSRPQPPVDTTPKFVNVSPSP